MLAELTKAKFKKSTFFEFWYFVLVFLVIALFDSAAFEFFFHMHDGDSLDFLVILWLFYFQFKALNMVLLYGFCFFHAILK